MTEELIRRRIVVAIENDVIEDGYFTPEVAKTLRAIADLIDADLAGRNTCEVYRSPAGTRATMTAENITGVCIPYREQDGPLLAASYVPEPS